MPRRKRAIALTFGGVRADVATATDLPAFGASEPTQAFFVRDDQSNPLVQFQSDGNVLLLQGSLIQSLPGQGSNPISATSDSDFILKKSSGQIIALIDKTNGNFRILSNHLIDESLRMTSSPEFVIRNSTDPGNDAQIIITNTGQLKTRGDVYSDSQL